MKKLILVVLILSITLSFLFYGVVLNKSYAHGEKKHKVSASKNNVTYTTHIKPLFDKKCAKCHGAKSPVHMEFVKDIEQHTKKMRGPRMNNYTDLTSFIIWPDTGSLMRALDDGKNTAHGKPGKMYKKLGATETERQMNLELFKRWVGNWTLKNWSEITKEEINKMTLIY
jgi:hypothetical protein